VLNQINIQDIIAIAKEAGNAIMQIYNQDFKVEFKQDNSPLTLADKKANNIIETGLNKLLVNLPILSEEGRDVHYKERKYWEYFWLVDPLDGTKEFIKKNGEFTVNIALIHKNSPVLGVVYAPALNVCYWAKKGEGAFKNNQRLPLETQNQRNTYKIVVSRSHMTNATKSFIDLIETDKDKELISIGSSLKICLVAEGKANIYPRLGATMEWDTAASNAVVDIAGGCVINTSTRDNIKYNTKETLINPYFVCYSLEESKKILY
jgi:3'(2'), 5'-bisphosphate nucleotidase